MAVPEPVPAGNTAAMPTAIDRVDATWLTGALREAGVLAAGDTVEITEVTPVGAGEGFVGALHRLALSSPNGVPSSLVVKLPADGPVRALADAFGSYTREIAFYRELAAHAPIRTPRSFVATQAHDCSDFVLVLEDLATATPADQLHGLPIEHAERVLDTLAALHAWSWQHPRLLTWEQTFTPIGSPAGRLMYEQYGELFRLAWPACVAVMADTLDPEIHEFGDRFVELIPHFLGALDSPRTLTHGDLRADNLFFDDRGQPILIDFQNVQQECGVREVAYVLSQSLPAEVRRGHDAALVRRYWEGLLALGVTDYSWDQAWRQYRVAVAFNLMWAVIPFLLWEGMAGRGHELLRQLVHRSSAAIADNQALSDLPS